MSSALAPAPSGRAPDDSAPAYAGIASIAAALPGRVVGNDEIQRRLGVDGDWIASRTGILERRHAPADATLTELASEASARALLAAGVDAADLDLILVATSTADDRVPNAAPLVAERLGARAAGAIDVGAACTGFLSALELAAAGIEARRADAVLVVGAELMSRVLDLDDPRTAGLFGDGAGAAVVVPGGRGSIGPVRLRADGSGSRAVTASHTENKVRMDGRVTFRAAVTRLTEVTNEVVADAGLSLDDIDLFVYHQANGRILSAVGERLSLPPERVVDSIATHGNTSAASIPIALDEALRDGRIGDGTRIFLGAFGAGLTWGGGLLEWGEGLIAATETSVRELATTAGGVSSEPRRPGGCALVTGASRGIGAAIAAELAGAGWPVAVNYRADREGAEAIVERLREEGGAARAIRADVSDPAAIDGLIGEAEEELGNVLVLVNNAGLTADGLSMRLTDEDWDRVLQTNLSAAFRLTRRAMGPMMRARYGRIVNVASVVGVRANAGQANYAASKAGLVAFTRTVAVEVARRGVTVNAVAPGLIDTEMTAGISGGLAEAIPARRAGTPEEVAACVGFLASDAASYVTGTTLTVDGGMTA